jgi:hypothetical protein
MFQSEKIGVELTLNEGEDAKEALDTARLLVEEYHKENNKELEEMRGTQVVTIDEKLSPDEQIIRDINSCSDLKILESYRLIVKKNPQFQETYNLKLNQLQ